MRAAAKVEAHRKASRRVWPPPPVAPLVTFTAHAVAPAAGRTTHDAGLLEVQATVFVLGIVSPPAVTTYTVRRTESPAGSNVEEGRMKALTSVVVSIRTESGAGSGMALLRHTALADEAAKTSVPRIAATEPVTMTESGAAGRRSATRTGGALAVSVANVADGVVNLTRYPVGARDAVATVDASAAEHAAARTQVNRKRKRRMEEFPLGVEERGIAREHPEVIGRPIETELLPAALNDVVGRAREEERGDI